MLTGHLFVGPLDLGHRRRAENGSKPRANADVGKKEETLSATTRYWEGKGEETL